MLFDELLTNHVGELGPYQIMVLCIIFFQEMFIGWNVMSPVFTAATPEHYCRHPNATILQNCSDEIIRAWTLPEGNAGKCRYLLHAPIVEGNLSLGYSLGGHNVIAADVCQIDNVSHTVNVNDNASTSRCTDWVYDQSLYQNTMVTEWSLVCDDAWKTKVLSSVYLAGMTTGYFVFGWMADRIGRRKASFIAGLPCFLVGVVSALVPNFSAFVVLRFLHGGLSCGKSIIAYVIAIEYVGKSKRVYVGAMYSMAWAVGYVAVGGIAYAIRDWRHMMIAITVPDVTYYILLYFFVPESPRWLYVQQRRNEADAIVRKMAKFNKVNIPDTLDITTPLEKSQVSALDIVRTPQLRRITLILLFLWATNGFTYYGLSLNTSALAGNPYVNFIISGAIEIPAYMFIMLTFTLWGRIWPFTVSMLIAGVSLLLMLAVPEDLPTLATGLAMIGKFFITATYTMLYIYTSEAYPTCIRSLGITSCGIASKIAAPIAPFFLLLDVFHPAISTIIFGTLAAVGGLVFITMPETKGQHLGQTIAEGEEMIKRSQNGLFCLNSNEKKGMETNSLDPAITPMLKHKITDNCKTTNGNLHPLHVLAQDA